MSRARTIGAIAERIIERLRWGKLTNRLGLTDYDPLLFIMYLVAQKIGREHFAQKPKARGVWCAAMKIILDDNQILENNPMLPCYRCDQAFEPVVDDALVALFLEWYATFDGRALLAVHTCPACGGRAKAARTRTYAGDMHTPKPGSVPNAVAWAEVLLEHCTL